jgi:hypothetical protein
LKKAISKSANTDYYLHLAQALEYRMEIEREMLQKTDAGKSELRRCLNYTLACCDHAIDLDLDLQKKNTQQAKDLKKRLKDLMKNSLNEPGNKDAKVCIDQAQGYV